jgi:hypothetical protein
VEFQVDDRISVPGFAGRLREWHIDAIESGEAHCHMVALPKTETSWSIEQLRQTGVAPRRPSWQPLVSA